MHFFGYKWSRIGATLKIRSTVKNNWQNSLKSQQAKR
jgi:hypothetical protein